MALPLPAPSPQENTIRFPEGLHEKPVVMPIDEFGATAIRAMQSLRANECAPSARPGLINQLLRDVSAQRLKLADAKCILQGLVEAVRNGFVPEDSVNVIANSVLGEIPTWNEIDRAQVLRDFLVAIADVGHSDLLRSAISVSAIRLIEGFPEPSAKVRGDLTLWLGYCLVRNRIPQQLRDEVVRVSFACMRNEAVDKTIRGKIAWVTSTLVDVTEYPHLPIDDILKYGDIEETPTKLREQIKNNLNRRALMSVGYF